MAAGDAAALAAGRAAGGGLAGGLRNGDWFAAGAGSDCATAGAGRRGAGAGARALDSSFTSPDPCGTHMRLPAELHPATSTALTTTTINPLLPDFMTSPGNPNVDSICGTIRCRRMLRALRNGGQSEFFLARLATSPTRFFSRRQARAPPRLGCAAARGALDFRHLRC